MTKILITSVSKKMIIFASIIENEENSEHKKPYQYLLEMPSPFIIVMTLTSGADPGFHRRGFTEGGSLQGVRGHPRKCDFRRLEAKSWCFEVSFF